MLTWYVGLAGILGALTRFGLTVLGSYAPSAFLPWGTLGANWAGCLLLGRLSYDRSLLRYPKLRTALTTGFIGSFTTFSTLSWELFSLLHEEKWLAALIYALLSLWGGLFFVRVGRRVNVNREERGSGE